MKVRLEILTARGAGGSPCARGGVYFYSFCFLRVSMGVHVSDFRK
jgi:hypothetical protein